MVSLSLISLNMLVSSGEILSHTSRMMEIDSIARTPPAWQLSRTSSVLKRSLRRRASTSSSQLVEALPSTQRRLVPENVF